MSRFDMDDAPLGEAYTARQSGNVAAAMEICRRILAANPTDPGATSLAGLCLAEAGDLDRGRPLIEKAVSLDPRNWRFLVNLSVLRELEGRIDEAIHSAREAAALAPDQSEPWGRLGQLCGRQGDFQGAVVALEKALALNPAHPGLALLLAAAAYEIGRYDLSGSALDTLERVAPDRPEALRLRTHLARKRNDPAALVYAAGRWLSADPDSQEARIALAYGRAQQEDYPGAVEIYRPLAVASPNDADHAATLAQYLLWSRDFQAAEQFYNGALEATPGHAAAAAGLARLNVYKGNFQDAAAFARTAIESDPANVDAYAQLLLADDSRLSDEDLRRLQIVANEPAFESDRRAIAWFTLGDIYHRRREHDRAFDAWKQANELKQDAAGQSENTRYSRQETEKMVDRLIAGFVETPRSAMHAADAAPQPLFIVGMPRSGTTLLESALAAHADISSGGELPAMPTLLARFLDWANEQQWQGGAIPDPIARQMRDSYLRQYDEYGVGTARFVTDKQPLNFLAVGLIRQVFPDAPVIHIHRNALETGFSIYRNNFTRSWAFSTSLPDIGHYYGEYTRLMAHWDSVFGGELATVEYERLVCDFEEELRRLIAYVGVEWDPNCLSYFRREGIVTTLSSAQVRKAPSRELMSSTAPYLRALQPLKDALLRAGVEVSQVGGLASE